VIFRPDIIEEDEVTVHHVQDNLKATMSRQETYANKRRRPLEFEVGDHIYLWVSPMKGMKRFGLKGKLAPRYIGPFPILEKCGTLAYKLKLSPSLAGVHDIFHVSQLKKCLKAPTDVVLPKVTPLEADLSYPEHPIKVLDQKDRVTRRKTTKFFKIQWSNHSKEEATWESEHFLCSQHPEFELPQKETCDCSLFLLGPLSISNLRARFLLRGEGYDTPSITIAAIVFYSTSTV
jgi:hypothetical protein